LPGKIERMAAIGSLLLLIVISLLVIRVATVILTATGMSRQAARFQARSAFTGAGFTTGESERVVNHPLRRKVIASLMLLGNAGIVASVSSLILGFSGRTFGSTWWRLCELVAGLLALLIISRSRRIDRWLNAVIARLLHRYTDLPDRDLSGLLQLTGPYAVSELAIGPDDWAAGRSLAELGLRDEGIVILGLTRADGRYLGAPTGATWVEAGDILIIYGRGELLRALDRRPAGAAGDASHRDAVRRQERAEREESAADEASRPGVA
jgi:TrkA-C domain